MRKLMFFAAVLLAAFIPTPGCDTKTEDTSLIKRATFNSTGAGPTFYAYKIEFDGDNYVVFNEGGHGGIVVFKQQSPAPPPPAATYYPGPPRGERQ